MTKQKSLQKNLREDYFLLLKYTGGNVPYLPLPGPNHLELKFYTIMQDFKCVLDFNCK